MSDPTPVRAFMGSNETNVTAAIKRHATEQRHMAVRDFTVEDLRQLFIPAEHRHAVRAAFEFARMINTDQYLNMEVPSEHKIVPDNSRLMAVFQWDWDDCNTGFFVPRDFKPVLQPDVPPEVMEKYHYVCRELARISFEFGMVRHVFMNLNVHGFCNTPQQMRYVWPAIRHLVDKAGLTELGKSLIESSPRAGDRARVPTELASFLVPSADIINRTLLIDKIDTGEKREFKLSVTSPRYSIDVDHAPSFFDGMS